MVGTISKTSPWRRSHYVKGSTRKLGANYVVMERSASVDQLKRGAWLIFKEGGPRALLTRRRIFNLNLPALHDTL